MDLTPTQLAIVGYLALQHGRYVTGKDIFGAVFHPRHDLRNVRVQIHRARRHGAPIESLQVGERTYGYRLADPFDNGSGRLPDGDGPPVSLLSLHKTEDSHV